MLEARNVPLLALLLSSKSLPYCSVMQCFPSSKTQPPWILKATWRCLWGTYQLHCIFQDFCVTWAFCVFLEIKWQQHAFYMIIAIRFFCARKAESSLQAWGAGSQPGLNWVWGSEGRCSALWVSALKPFKPCASLGRVRSQGRASCSWLRRRGPLVAAQMYLENGVKDKTERI